MSPSPEPEDQAPYPIHANLNRALSYGVLKETLQVIVQGVADMAGFAVATIGVFRPNDLMETIAAAGNDEVRWALVGETAPTPVVLDLLKMGERWGNLLRFVPHEQAAVYANDIWVGDSTIADGPDAWQPLDVLMAPLIGDDGTLQGILAVDQPLDGRRPGPDQRRMLETYASQAARAVLRTFERDVLGEQIRLAEAARRVVRTASAKLDLVTTLEDCQVALLEGFRCSGLWMRTLPTDEDPMGQVIRYPAAPDEVDPPSDVRDIVIALGRECWAQQRVAIVAQDRLPQGLISVADHRRAMDFFRARDVASVMLVPLGAGDECLGTMTLARSQSVEWSDVEAATALDIGHDLGRTILNARFFQHEQRLARELRELSSYKAKMIDTIAHELKNPLTAILGNVDLLQGAPDLAGRGEVSLTAIGQNADRLARLVDDLLLLSTRRATHDDSDTAPVDLREPVAQALAALADDIAAKQLRVTALAAPHPVMVRGDVHELTRLCGNLLSNAVRFTPPGRAVRILIDEVGEEVTLAVTDEGIGISEEDQIRLFHEFFRADVPDELTTPGTGLGLAVAQRIVERHHGRIDAESALGQGSTFTVWLPGLG
ncbi:sensor histidine kinase [Nocardioides pacificus]